MDRNFDAPTVVLRDDRLLVSFLAWIGFGGEVHTYDLTFKDDGGVALIRATVAHHLGDHEDRP